MRKYIMLAIKIMPIITLYKGITSGGARMKPFVDMAKVVLTQYEVSRFMRLIVEDFNRQGTFIGPKDFPAFIKDNYHSQYSVVPRELRGDKSHDHSIDIWGKPFQLFIDEDSTLLKISSAGPDGVILNKDDIAADLTIGHAKPKTPKAPVAEQTPVEELAEDASRQPASDGPEVLAGDYDEEGFDRDGFNREGYDRDGFDSNGIHRSEKEVQAQLEPPTEI